MRGKSSVHDHQNMQLINIIENGHDLAANVLAFPHHGGRAGAVRLNEFTKELYKRVNPEYA
ncbi:MAG: hypothetical protein GY820_01695 [Gammaproteobacteria bacterium]|nr:hypothetical protein [Gammaproteobacteria bacterium]